MALIRETPESRAAELAVAQQIFPPMRFEHLPMRYVLDWAVFNDVDELVMLAEIKVRTCASTDFPTYILSAHKVEAAQRWGSMLHRPVWLIVQWTDRLASVRLDGMADYEPWYYRWGGRVDRKDPEDMEILAHIPIAAFRDW